MVERDVINAESCYQENGEEVRRQEVRPQGRRQEGHAQRGGEESLREEVRPQGRRQEGHAQRGGEESLREEGRPQGRRQEGHAQRGGEESLREEGLREEGCGKARASQAQESGANADLWIVRHVARRLVGLRVPTYRLIRRG